MDESRDRVERIEDLLRLVADGHHRIGADFAASQQLAHSDLRALFEVMDAEVHGDPLTPGRLGARLGVTSGAVTGIVDRLEQAGHVERRADPADRRRTRLHQSEHGFRTAIAFFGPLGERSTEVAARFSDDELAVVERFLTLTAEALTETGDPSPAAHDTA